jgi:hypothetical protein
MRKRSILFILSSLVLVAMAFQFSPPAFDLPPENYHSPQTFIQPDEPVVHLAGIGTSKDAVGGTFGLLIFGMAAAGVGTKDKATWLSFLGAVVALGLGVTGVMGMEISLSLVGVLGFGGLAGLRAFIKSSGSKTFIVAALGALGVAGSAFGVLTPEQFQIWLSTFGLLGGATLTHAVLKREGYN